jgi:hypothetical protein
MLLMTPAAFVFIYSKYGVHVVSASAVVLSGKGIIDTTKDYYRDLGSFYGEVYKCFLGDFTLGDKYRDEDKMKQCCEELKSQRGLAIIAKY